MRQSASNKKGRVVNLMLQLMQMISPILALLSMMVTMTQETKLSMITKNYMTIAMMLNIDTMFAGSLSPRIKANAKKINSEGGFTISKDKNSFNTLFNRMMKNTTFF